MQSPINIVYEIEVFETPKVALERVVWHFLRCLLRIGRVLFNSHYKICSLVLVDNAICVVNTPVHEALVRKYVHQDYRFLPTDLVATVRLRCVLLTIRNVISQGFRFPKSSPLLWLERVLRYFVLELDYQYLCRQLDFSLRANSCISSVIAFELGFVGYAVCDISRSRKIKAVYFQHGMQMRNLQVAMKFDEYLLPTPKDREFLENLLGEPLSGVRYFYELELRNLPNPRPRKKIIVWALEYQSARLSIEFMQIKLRHILTTFSDCGWITVLRVHPRETSPWHRALVENKSLNARVDEYAHLPLFESLVKNEAMLVGSFSSASLLESLVAGFLPVFVSGPHTDAIVSDFHSFALDLLEPSVFESLKTMEVSDIDERRDAFRNRMLKSIEQHR